jgi:hypothetical protein
LVNPIAPQMGRFLKIKVMKYQFKNGASVDGTVDQILSIAKSLGETVDLSKFEGLPRGYYKSSSKGVMRISEMTSPHLRSALLKKSRAHFEELSLKKTASNREFCRLYVGLAENPEVEDLFTELSKRK